MSENSGAAETAVISKPRAKYDVTLYKTSVSDRFSCRSVLVCYLQTPLHQIAYAGAGRKRYDCTKRI